MQMTHSKAEDEENCSTVIGLKYDQMLDQIPIHIVSIDTVAWFVVGANVFTENVEIESDTNVHMQYDTVYRHIRADLEF